MTGDTKRRLGRHPGLVATVMLLALALVFSLATIVWMSDSAVAQQELGALKITKVITGDTPEGGPWTPDDFSITVTGPGGFSWTGSFPANGLPIVLQNLVPGTYVVTENATGSSWIVTGEGSVTVSPGPGQTGLVITNTGSTTTTEQRLGILKIAKVITGDTPEGGPWTPDDFSITVTGPGGFSWTGSFPADGHPIVLTDLVPGVYTVTENATGVSWVVTGEGPVTVAPGLGPTGLVITNTGSTTTTTEQITTTTTEETTTTTAPETTTTTAPETTTTTVPETTTTAATETTVTTTASATSGSTPIPSDIATGGGGTAGLGTGIYALIALAGVLGAGLVGGALRLVVKHK